MATGTYHTTVRRDGTVRLWDVYDQQWWDGPAHRVRAAILATLPADERGRVMRAAKRHPDPDADEPCHGHCEAGTCVHCA